MSEIQGIGQHNLSHIPSPCKHCLYWQTEGSIDDGLSKQERARRKQEWLAKTIERFGRCSSIAYVKGIPVGFSQYAPQRFFPRIKKYMSGEPSEEAIFLACLYIVKKNERRKRFGSNMLQNLIAELRGRGFKIVETFARKDSENNPSGPLELYLKHGFKVRYDRDNFPLVRLEL